MCCSGGSEQSWWTVSWRASQTQSRWDVARRAGLALLIVALAGLTSLVPAAAQHPNGVGLVIRHGDGTLLEIYVQFAEESLSGEELLNRSGLDFSEAPFGGLGAGVCSIGGEGCPSDNCYCKSFTTPAFYWRYYALQAGGWSEQIRGPSTRALHDGEVDGWSWTAGDPALPALTIDDIAAANGVDRNAPDPAATTAATAVIIPPIDTPTETPTPLLPPPTPTPTLTPAVATATQLPAPSATATTPVTTPAVAAAATTATITRATASATRPATATAVATQALASATRAAPTAVATTLGVVIAPSGTAVALLPAPKHDSGSSPISYFIFGAMAAAALAVGGFAIVRVRRRSDL